MRLISIQLAARSYRGFHFIHKKKLLQFVSPSHHMLRRFYSWKESNLFYIFGTFGDFDKSDNDGQIIPDNEFFPKELKEKLINGKQLDIPELAQSWISCIKKHYYNLQKGNSWMKPYPGGFNQILVMDQLDEAMAPVWNNDIVNKLVSQTESKVDSFSVYEASTILLALQYLNFNRNHSLSYRMYGKVLGGLPDLELGELCNLALILRSDGRLVIHGHRIINRLQKIIRRNTSFTSEDLQRICFLVTMSPKFASTPFLSHILDCFKTHMTDDLPISLCVSYLKLHIRVLYKVCPADKSIFDIEYKVFNKFREEYIDTASCFELGVFGKATRLSRSLKHPHRDTCIRHLYDMVTAPNAHFRGHQLLWLLNITLPRVTLNPMILEIKRMYSKWIADYIDEIDPLSVMDIAPHASTFMEAEVRNKFEEKFLEHLPKNIKFSTGLKRCASIARRVIFINPEIEEKVILTLVKQLEVGRPKDPKHASAVAAAIFPRITHVPEFAEKVLKFLPSTSPQSLVEMNNSLSATQEFYPDFPPEIVSQLTEVKNVITSELLNKSDNEELSFGAISRISESLLIHPAFNQLRDPLLADKMISKYLPSLENPDVIKINRICKIMYKLSYFNAEIIDQLASILIDADFSPDPYICYFDLIAKMSYRPKRWEELLPIVNKKFDTYYGTLKGSCSAQVWFTWQLATLEHYDKATMEYVFSLPFIEMLDQHLKEKPWSRRTAVNFKNLNRGVVIERPEYGIPWFHQETIRPRRMTRTRMHYDMNNTLASILGGKRYFKNFSRTKYSILLKIEFVMDNNNKPVVYDELPANIPKSWERFTIMLIEETGICSNTDRVLSDVDTHARWFSKLGYTVVQVPYRKWFSMGHQESDVKKEYLSNLIKKAQEKRKASQLESNQM